MSLSCPDRRPAGMALSGCTSPGREAEAGRQTLHWLAALPGPGPPPPNTRTAAFPEPPSLCPGLRDSLPRRPRPGVSVLLPGRVEGRVEGRGLWEGDMAPHRPLTRGSRQAGLGRGGL